MSKNVIEISLDQLKILSNPTRLEIHTSLRTDGPATARQLAERLEVDELSLYYHLRKLVSNDLLATSSRNGATKPETVYSVRGRFLVKDMGLKRQENRYQRCRNVDTMLRACSRENRLATEVLQDEIDDRSFIGRTPVRLTAAKYRQLRHRLKELTEWIVESHDPNGEKYSVSIFALPIVATKNDKKR